VGMSLLSVCGSAETASIPVMRRIIGLRMWSPSNASWAEV
jgi:hypothetical protein